jgi:hypothetical protein
VDTAREILKARRLVWALARLVVKTRQFALVEGLLDLDELLLSIEATAAPPLAPIRAPARRSRGRPPTSGDRAIGVQEAARLLKRTPTWVYRHRGELPRLPGRGPLKFSERGIETLRRRVAALRHRVEAAVVVTAPSAEGLLAGLPESAAVGLVPQPEGSGEDGARPLPDEGA